MNKYRLIAMSFDGEYKTCGDRFTDSFASIDDAWGFANDMGSTWFFYPFFFVVSASGKTVVDSPYLLECFNGKRLETVVKAFSKLNSQVSGYDADDFAFALRDMYM